MYQRKIARLRALAQIAKLRAIAKHLHEPDVDACPVDGGAADLAIELAFNEATQDFHRTVRQG